MREKQLALIQGSLLAPCLAPDDWLEGIQAWLQT